MPTRPDPRSFLPLTAAVFHILLSLADADRHGYGIAQDVAKATDGEVQFGPGTLYGTLARMEGAGLIEPTEARAPGDPRRRFFRLTALGREVARAEARRLAALVGLARGKALLPPRRS